VFFAAEETAGGLERFAAWNVDPAMRASNHRLHRGWRRVLPALASKTGQHEVNDDYCDDEKEELAHAAMGCLRRGSRRGVIIPARDERTSGREAGRGDWIRRFAHLVRYVGWYSTRCRGERARKAVPTAAV
jgi:hypothetical protein